jgi:hypothetical protein
MASVCSSFTWHCDTHGLWPACAHGDCFAVHPLAQAAALGDLEGSSNVEGAGGAVGPAFKVCLLVVLNTYLPLLAVAVRHQPEP